MRYIAERGGLISAAAPLDDVGAADGNATYTEHHNRVEVVKMR